MLGARGLAAGLAASTIVAVLAALVAGPAPGLLADLAVVYMVGAVLGFAYGVLDRLLFFVKRSWKAEGFLLALAALLALNGRGAILSGAALYGAMTRAISHPLLGDVIASLAATGLWGIPMVLIHAAIAPRKPKRRGILGALPLPGIGAPAPPQHPPEAVEKPEPRVAAPPPGYVICPVCGTPNEPENNYCKRCGAPLPRLGAKPA